MIQSPRVDHLSKVSDIIDLSKMEWKTEIIARYFNERDSKCILAIPLSIRAPQDSLPWAFTKNGIYSVKTAYMVGKGCNLEDFHQA